MIRPIPVLLAGAAIFAGLLYMTTVSEDCEERDGTLVRGAVGYECVEEAP